MHGEVWRKRGFGEHVKSEGKESSFRTLVSFSLSPLWSVVLLNCVPSTWKSAQGLRGIRFYLFSLLGSQWSKSEKDLWTSLRKALQLAVLAMVGIEEEEEEVLEHAARELFGLASLSSSLIVSNIFVSLCLMTLINCGGATSETNLAMREFTIFFLAYSLRWNTKQRMKI